MRHVALMYLLRQQYIFFSLRQCSRFLTPAVWPETGSPMCVARAPNVAAPLVGFFACFQGAAVQFRRIFSDREPQQQDTFAGERTRSVALPSPALLLPPSFIQTSSPSPSPHVSPSLLFLDVLQCAPARRVSSTWCTTPATTSWSAPRPS